jgi:hypothetical protein
MKTYWIWDSSNYDKGMQAGETRPYFADYISDYEHERKTLLEVVAYRDFVNLESRLKWAEDLLKVAHGLILVAEQQTPKIQIAYESFLSDIAKGFPGGEKE